MRKYLLAWVLCLVPVPAFALNMTWLPNSEPDLAGYRVYQCITLACEPSQRTRIAEIPVPTTAYSTAYPQNTTIYGVTAYDQAQNESPPAVITWEVDHTAPATPQGYKLR